MGMSSIDKLYGAGEVQSVNGAMNGAIYSQTFQDIVRELMST